MLSFLNNNAGFSYTKRPDHLKAHYKYQRQGSDTAIVHVLLTKWNTTTKQQNTIGVGRLNIILSSLAYTEALIKINYKSQEIPDTAFTNIVSSAEIGYAGSTLFVDDLSFVFSSPNSINENAESPLTISIFPNPAKDVIHFTAVSPQTYQIKIYNIMGNHIETCEVKDNNGSISTTGFTLGIYTYRAFNKNGNSLYQL